MAVGPACSLQLCGLCTCGQGEPVRLADLVQPMAGSLDAASRASFTAYVCTGVHVCVPVSLSLPSGYR